MNLTELFFCNSGHPSESESTSSIFATCPFSLLGFTHGVYISWREDPRCRYALLFFFLIHDNNAPSRIITSIYFLCLSFAWSSCALTAWSLPACHYTSTYASWSLKTSSCGSSTGLFSALYMSSWDETHASGRWQSLLSSPSKVYCMCTLFATVAHHSH